MYSMNPPRPVSGFNAEQLIGKLVHVHGQLHALLDYLPKEGWLGARAEHLNPPLWEIGHIVWFQERWCLRAQPNGPFSPSLLPGADALYNSSTVAHDSRWTLPLLTPAEVDDYSQHVAVAVAARLRDAFSDELAYFAELCVYHELMHIEALRMAFQSESYAAPAMPENPRSVTTQPERLTLAAGDVELGSGPNEGFIFDNEKWRHPVTITAFDIDSHPVSEAIFADFVDAGGYQQKTGWSEDGLAWRTTSGATHPVYWRKSHGSWQVRRFSDWTTLAPDAPVLHVNRFEAEACAAWLGRRLPTAGQWVRATGQAHFQRGSCWEWMQDPFAPYPGFTADPYQDYSQPWFHSHGELRGGGPFTDPVLKRRGFRNFYLPHRRDPFSGFRTVSKS